MIKTSFLIILIFQDVNNPEATALVKAVEKMSGRKQFTPVRLPAMKVYKSRVSIWST